MDLQPIRESVLKASGKKPCEGGKKEKRKQTRDVSA